MKDDANEQKPREAKNSCKSIPEPQFDIPTTGAESWDCSEVACGKKVRIRSLELYRAVNSVTPSNGNHVNHFITEWHC
ncbi:hypothetical protein Y1Q_0002705 [Alligator mississippiensis]|uniref:Uncharacterized protein n=1 Tax=Alligator mississippiensis TaxID=8496 RepID=A0A151NZ38_ALLMI|nr:hypothetical protein Y1Q_0002705 [Alligator mississippiensis]